MVHPHHVVNRDCVYRALHLLVGASHTGPTLNGQPDIKDFKAGSMGEKPSAPSEPGCFKVFALLRVKYTWNQKKNPPDNR
jgi:hypothetical protein